MSTFQFLLILISLTVLTACSMELRITELNSSQKPGLPGLDLLLKVSQLPTEVPEGYPYYGTAVLENAVGGVS